MRKLMVLSFITVDGVIQAPGGPGEDTSGGFTYGGWQAPYLDEFLDKILDEELREPFDLKICLRSVSHDNQVDLFLLKGRDEIVFKTRQAGDVRHIHSRAAGDVGGIGNPFHDGLIS